MTRILLIACIVLSLGAAVLGYINRGKLVETTETLQQTESTLQTTKADLAKTTKNLEERSQEVATLTNERDQLNANLADTRNELTTTKESLAKAESDAKAHADELESLRTDMEAKDQRIAELEQAGTTELAGTAAAEAPELAARVAELETLNQQLTEQSSSLQARVNELQAKERARQAVQVRQGLQGTVLAVNQAWNFVVLSLGDRSGLVPNAELLVKRGDQYLGKVRVTSVEPATSIADIVLNTVPRGFTVMPGDTVIFEGQRD